MTTTRRLSKVPVPLEAEYLAVKMLTPGSRADSRFVTEQASDQAPAPPSAWRALLFAAATVVAPDTAYDMRELPPAELLHKHRIHTNAEKPVTIDTSGPKLARSVYVVEPVSSRLLMMLSLMSRSTILLVPAVTKMRRDNAATPGVVSIRSSRTEAFHCPAVSMVFADAVN